jgi:transposase
MIDKIDARCLPAAALEEKHRQAVRLDRRDLTRAEIGEIVGVHADTVGRWLKRYAEQGAAGLRPGQRGRRKGSGRRLTEAQERTIEKILVEKPPDRLELDYALWTREAVRELIDRQLGIKLPIRTVGHYLRRWGMTPQKPVKQAYEQQPRQVQDWLDERYPTVQAQAQREGAEIYWGDEMGLRSDCQHERGYAPRGQTPIVRLSAKRSSVNMISAITNRGKVRFRLFEGSMNAVLLLDFMKRLTKAAQRKVILILDNLSVHHAKPVKEWLAEHRRQIEVVYLPGYSPELNPDEYLNCDVKAGVHSGSPARSKKQLKRKALRHMRKLQKMPRRVASYFHHEKIRYAA